MGGNDTRWREDDFVFRLIKASRGGGECMVHPLQPLILQSASPPPTSSLSIYSIRAHHPVVSASGLIVFHRMVRA